jgi:drug/metabolite transporter (DMT)-like permease
MIVVGSLLALLSGMLNATAAWLEKREGMRTATARSGMRLLAALARRPAWLAAMVLSALAWVGEAASLALAPVPIVATLRNAGRGLLVVGGGRWLNERFSRLEILGVALASGGGIITAIGAANSKVVRKPLSNWTEIAVGASCILAAGVVSGLSSRLSPSGLSATGGDHRRKVAGIATGAAVGLLYAGTGVFTKEIGDRFAIYGIGGLTAVLSSAGLWLMVLMSVWAQSLLQQAFRRANAASVSAANASVASLGLIGAGFALYHQGLPRGSGAALLLGGILVSLAGTLLLVGSKPVQGAEPVEDGEPVQAVEAREAPGTPDPVPGPGAA